MLPACSALTLTPAAGVPCVRESSHVWVASNCFAATGGSGIRGTIVVCELVSSTLLSWTAPTLAGVTTGLGDGFAVGTTFASALTPWMVFGMGAAELAFATRLGGGTAGIATCALGGGGNVGCCLICCGGGGGGGCGAALGE